jgi:2-polyprenyl-3-methyl-5-hydroxy-6-metoxy-1,4-benzoquinol methylase
MLSEPTSAGRTELTTPNEHNAYQARYFDRSAQGNVRLQPTDSPYVQRHLDRTLEVLRAGPKHRVLEVGAGLGRFTSLMLERGLDVLASDLSDHLLAKLRARHPGLETVASDVATVAANTSIVFDRVVGFFMLHHLADLDRVFAGLRQVTRSGARIAFCEPNAFHVPYYLQIAFSRQMTWQGDGGVAKMRPGVVLRAMERAGFAQARSELYGFAPPVIYNHPSGRRLDHALERIPQLTPLRAFQIFSASVP